MRSSPVIVLAREDRARSFAPDVEGLQVEQGGQLLERIRLEGVLSAIESEDGTAWSRDLGRRDRRNSSDERAPGPLPDCHAAPVIPRGAERSDG